MKRIPIGLVLLCTCSTLAFSQWRKVASLPYTTTTGVIREGFVQSIYFLDLPGPLRIGFVGTQGEIFKTTDGGESWREIQGFPGYVESICFRDSLMGWFVLGGDPGYLYATSDGGESWTRLDNTEHFGNFICYLTSSSTLFSLNGNGFMVSSSNSGVSWQTVWPGTTGNIAFSNDSVGVAVTYDRPDSTIIRTTDSGLTWTRIKVSGTAIEPLAIKGSSTFLKADFGDLVEDRIIIQRSEDNGATWKSLSRFESVWDTAQIKRGPIGTGKIVGDLRHLYIQTDSGIYTSTDQGTTWRCEGEPRLVWSSNGSGLYAAKGKAFAGQSFTKDNSQTGGGLWMQEYGAAGVNAPPGISKRVSAYPNPSSNVCRIDSATRVDALYDILGRDYYAPFAYGSLDLTNVASGTYYARLITAYGETRTVKIVKE